MDGLPVSAADGNYLPVNVMNYSSYVYANTEVGGGTITMVASIIQTAIMTQAMGSASISISGTFTAGSTLNFEYRYKTTGTFRPLLVRDSTDTTNTTISTLNGDGTDHLLFAPLYGPYIEIRVRCSAFHAGDSIVVKIATQEGGSSNQSLPLPPGGNAIGKVKVSNNPIPFDYDYMGLTYTGNDLTTIVYKTGGAAGTVVATATMTYSGGLLQTWART